MRLSEEDKTKHPYYLEMQKEEERKRWVEATKSPEFVKARKAFDRALQDYIHQQLKGNLKARKMEKPTVQMVVKDTFGLTHILCQNILNKYIPYLTEKMLERFDLVKKKK